jgi:hypothetical protein
VGCRRGGCSPVSSRSGRSCRCGRCRRRAPTTRCTGSATTWWCGCRALNAGDPAVDLLVAWNLFSGEARERYRTALGVDDATWVRGRGWALSVALIVLPYYRETNPALVAQSWTAIRAVLAG